MLKINSYHLFFLAVLFFNSSSGRLFSFNNSQTFNQYSRASNNNNSFLPPVVNLTNSNVTSQFHCINNNIPQAMRENNSNPNKFFNNINQSNATNISAYTNIHNVSSVVPHTQQQEVTYPTATAQSEQSSPSSIYQHPQNSVQVQSLFPIESNITSQPYNSYFNSSIDTFIPPFMLSVWDPNNSTNAFMLPYLNCNHSTSTFANIDNISLSIPDDSIPSNTTNTSTTINNNTTPSLVPHTQRQKVVDAKQNKTRVLTEKKKKKRKSNKKMLTKTYTCPICKKNLTNKESMAYHLRTHNKNRPRPWECHICHNRFAEKTILRGHIQRHNKEKIFKCDYCVMHFKTKQEKIEHHRIHTGDRPYKCTLCDKCFAAKSTLRYHMGTHTGERQFKCNICQKGLSSKRGLKDHLNTHSGKKPYKCDQCTKTYATESGLYYHIKTHNRPKPYTCKYCGASFDHKTKYKNHIKYEEETDEDRKCHRCQKLFSDKYHLIRHNKSVHPRINS